MTMKTTSQISAPNMTSAGGCGSAALFSSPDR